MKYVVTKPYKKRCISEYVNFSVGTPCESQGKIIMRNGKPICSVTSQDAYDYFSRDDDGHGIERGKLVREIMNTLAKQDDRHQDRWNRIWSNLALRKFKRPEYQDYWLWNFDFYNADIADLRHIRDIVKEE